MISNESLIKPSRLLAGLETTNKIPRRGLLGGAMGALLAAPLGLEAQGQGAHSAPTDPFIIFLTGLYQAVPPGKGPADNLGLTTVNLNDGTWAKTPIYPVYGLPTGKNGKNNEPAIGTNYVTLATFTTVFELPGGAMVLQFPPGTAFQAIYPDGVGGQYNAGSFGLPIVEANGIYADFLGGHDHMVNRMHQLVAGIPFTGFPKSGYDEHCFCVISKYQFPEK